jgi:acetylornithine deacetylase
VDDAGAVTTAEQRVVDEIAGRRDELVALLTDLIAFDTTAREVDDPPRDEAALQGYLGDRLGRVGASVDLWEPAPGELAAGRMVPPGLGFEGRPQLAARFAGTGGGPSLMFNGHIDVVSPEPLDGWTSHPHRAEIRDGRLYGRGACDMKGGVASMTFAAQVLAELGVKLAGDLTVCTVTDEESTGAGGLAAVAHGVRADAGIVTEPSNFDVWVACRGSLIPTIRIPGRAGHAGIRAPHWQDGGAVNAIDKSRIVLDALARLEADWRERADNRHPFLSPGDIIATVIAGGEWIVSYPSSVDLTYHVAYLPANADADGWGTRVEREIEDCVARAAATDPWLAENPPTFSWAPEVPAAEVPVDAPIVDVLLAAGRAVGRPGRPSGLDNWHDGATFTRFGGTPCVCYGTGTLDCAHRPNESVPVDDLVSCAQALALAAMRFCGTTGPA